MKKIILMGRSECGKTTLQQALKGDTIHYYKTQYINHYDVVIDTPGEYAETNRLGRALALYSYEADVVGLVISAEEPYSLFPPNIVAQSTRPVIGIITQIDAPRANPDQAERWLRLSGCKDIFRVSSYTGEGIWQILEYLREPGDVLPWDKEEAEKPRTVLSTKFGKTEESQDQKECCQ
ncbi:MAG TPA: ethanolamine utilization protein EutP [Candidatus Limivivens merdigallinarum]|uniref:Ethanolamine utilization protein EutP n=1 Tax=Candidatus Limivivens merdigallinarum TaxID=2840859 RepID=A0A9D1D0T7_9FIRM|nr:ethanolamine utilization protein EutP [Candidatus Limivivens merdigallinarum]